MFAVYDSEVKELFVNLFCTFIWTEGWEYLPSSFFLIQNLRYDTSYSMFAVYDSEVKELFEQNAENIYQVDFFNFF